MAAPGLDPMKLSELRRVAEGARRAVYVPYSNFTVLVAVETTDGRLYGGGNVENANYSLSKHAEESAALAAIADGALERLGRRWLKTVYVLLPSRSAPCGGCRQFLWEFAADDAVWATEHSDTGEVISAPFTEILPYAFGPNDLGID